jgi:LysR family nitrogen assimilation transcriptional regulator
VLSRATAIVEQVRSLREDVREYSQVPKGELRLGILPLSTELLIPRALSNLIRNAPLVRVSVRSGMSGAVGDWLRTDQIDVAVMHSPWSGTDLISEPIIYGQMVLVLPSKEATTSLGVPEQERYALREIATMPLIVTEAGNIQRTLLEREAAVQGLTLNTVLEADSVATIVTLVREGLGCTVVAYSAVHSLLRQGGLRVVPLADPVIWTDLSIVTSSKRPVTAAMRAYIACVKAEVKRLTERDDIPQAYFALAPPPRG